jgi:hypothetical protein
VPPQLDIAGASMTGCNFNFFGSGTDIRYALWGMLEVGLRRRGSSS